MGLVVAPVVLAFGIALAVLATGSRFRPLAALLAAVAGIAAPLVVPPAHTFVRFVFAALALVLLMRIVDLGVDRRRWPVGLRTRMFTGLVDVREATPIPRRADPFALVVVALYLGLAWLGWSVAHATDHLLVRWAGGVLVIYGLADVACATVVPLYALFGWRIPRQHHAPILASSVGAFWSKHYNLNVSAWLARHVHRPLARRGRATLGLATAFVASAAAHAWVAWVPLDVPMALTMAAFFTVQAVPVIVERSWAGFARLPLPARRAWTIAWLLVPSPLFVEPFLRILEG
jgi:hypothetical protein